MKRRLHVFALALLPLCSAIWTAAAQVPTGSAEAFDPRSSLDSARSEERSILDQLAMIDGQLEQVLRETLELRESVDEIERERAANAAAVQEADQQLQQLEDGVRRQIRSLYMILRKGVAQLLFGADDPRELRRRGYYITHIVAANAGRLSDYRKVREDRKSALDALDVDRRRMDALRTDLELKETELRDQRAVRMDLLQKVRERRELALQVLGEMNRAREHFDSALDSRSRAPMPTDAWAGGMGFSGSVPTAPSNANTFRESYGRLPWPVRGRLVRRFGVSDDPVTGQKTTSHGIDIASEFGEPVRAVYRGVVRLAGPLKGFGQTVAVSHGPYTTIYAHLGGVRVRQDDVVNAGQVIGLVGNSGLTAVDGYRLTFEVRYNNAPQDPLPWLQP